MIKYLVLAAFAEEFQSYYKKWCVKKMEYVIK